MIIDVAPFFVDIAAIAYYIVIFTFHGCPCINVTMYTLEKINLLKSQNKNS